MMAACDMCGEDEKLFLTEIEGTRLNVCSNCSKYGKVIKSVKPPEPKKKSRLKATKPEIERIQVVRDDYPDLIRKKREKLGLKQIELAKMLAERESIIQKLESGSYTPSLALARKLEKQLDIGLIEQKEIKKQQLKSKSHKLTIGDMINL